MKDKIVEEVLESIKKQNKEDIENELELYHIKESVSDDLFESLLELIEAISVCSSEKALASQTKDEIDWLDKILVYVKSNVHDNQGIKEIIELRITKLREVEKWTN